MISNVTIGKESGEVRIWYEKKSLNPCDKGRGNGWELWERGMDISRG